MASNRAGVQLTELHRRRQLQLRAVVVAGVLELWPAFDLADIDGSWPPLEAGLLTLLRARRRESSELAANYYRALRMIEGVPGEPPTVQAEAPAPPLERATLRLLGPIAAKKAIARKNPRVAADTLTRLTGSVARQVLDGGRRTITATVRADRAATGWRRITDSSPCDFCASIARQGVVGTDVDFAAHDHCGCSSEPVFGSTAPFTSFLDDFEADVARRSATGVSNGIDDLVDGNRGFLIR